MIQEIEIKKLKLLEKNPRRITKEQMQKLCGSLTQDPEFLQKRPILVNLKDGQHQVYAGNQRVRAAKQLGWKTIPCDIDENLDEQLMKARVIRDNFIFGEWNFDELANSYEIDDLLNYGFTLADFEIDMPDTNVESIQNKKQFHKCPECGCEFV